MDIVDFVPTRRTSILSLLKLAENQDWILSRQLVWEEGRWLDVGLPGK